MATRKKITKSPVSERDRVIEVLCLKLAELEKKVAELEAKPSELHRHYHTHQAPYQALPPAQPVPNLPFPPWCGGNGTASMDNIKKFLN
jgi:hypothetical protein